MLALITASALFSLVALLFKHAALKTRRLAGLTPALFGGLLSLGVLGFFQRLTDLLVLVGQSLEKEAIYASGLGDAAAPLYLAVLAVLLLLPLGIAAMLRDRLGPMVASERKALWFSLVSPLMALGGLCCLTYTLAAFALMFRDLDVIPFVNTMGVGAGLGTIGAVMSPLGVVGSVIGSRERRRSEAALAHDEVAEGGV